MAFEGCCFIKTPSAFKPEYSTYDPALMFRKKFNVPGGFESATLSVCGLGYGYYYLNGKPVTKDLFIAPVSDYNKTLWYNVYDVSDLLQPGQNIAAAILGNGFYNETLTTPWKHNKVSWRDKPKFIFSLEIKYKDRTLLIPSDSTWKCSENSPVYFNQLRNGEYFDARLYDENWNRLNFDDASWEYAIIDDKPPKGIFRKCECEPIRECAIYPAKSCIKTGETTYVFDIGQNISGYIRLKINQEEGDKIIIRYAEQLNPDNTLNLNNMDKLYPDSVFATDIFICNGKPFVWSPRFAYHGFRYIELTGLTEEPTLDTVSGVFVHQDVEDLSQFRCSDDFINKLYYLGKMSTLSNLFYMPTDCPTREKLGWANDAQASAEQMLTNFNVVKLFKKWMVDIIDSIREDGAIPGIIPTSGFGYEWGTGPVSSGVLFEIPYKIYLYTGNKDLLCENIPYFKKHLNYIRSRADNDELIGYGLCDWAGPYEHLEASPTPVKFTDTILYIKCLKIAMLSAELSDNSADYSEFKNELNRITEIFMNAFLNEDGTCKVDEQTAVSMLIYHDVYYELEPLKQQLKRCVEKHSFHHYCGMVGLRHLYEALNKCGLHEYAFKIIKAEGYPSYSDWIKGGATTLWETWQPGNSKNHHMYSDVLSWITKTLVGISPVIKNPGFKTVSISPVFIDSLTYCEGSYKTVAGTISVSWNRQDNNNILLKLDIPEGVTAELKLVNSYIMNEADEITTKAAEYRNGESGEYKDIEVGEYKVNEVEIHNKVEKCETNETEKCKILSSGKYVFSIATRV